jgi:hypothetical protein
MHTGEIHDRVCGDLSIKHVASEYSGACSILLASVDHEVVTQHERAVCDIIMAPENVSKTCKSDARL